MQTWIVALVLLVSVSYAVWVLAPQALRRALARAMLHLPLPARVRGSLLAATQRASGCGCSGCDRGGAVPAGQTGVAQPITLRRSAKYR